MISVFGPRAEAIRHALPGDLHAIVFDENNVSEAAREALGRRERGERFYGLPLVDDLRVQSANEIARELLRLFPDAVTRFEAARMLGRGTLEVNGEPAANRWDEKKATQLLTKTNYVLGLCDELLVRTFFEYRKFAERRNFFGRAFRRLQLPASVPPFVRATPRRSSVVVWTGRRPVDDAATALIGLAAHAGTVVYVGERKVAEAGAGFIPRDGVEVAEELAHAACVVCIDPADPADAVALARAGVPVVAPLTSAAYESGEAIFSWDAADATALPGLVAAACARAGA